MMYKKLMILLSMLIIMSISAAALTITVDNPSDDEAINGTYNFTATLSYSGGDNVSNCTFSTTDDGVFGISRLGNITSYWNESDTTALTETGSTTVSVKCYNYSNNALLDTGTSTTVAIDNTAPTCSQTANFEIIDVLNPLSIDCTDSSDTTSLSYSIVLTGSDGTTTTKTPSSGVADFDGDETGDLGWATATCTVTDEVSKEAECSSDSIWIKSEGDDAIPDTEPPTQDISTDEKDSTLPMILILGALGAFIVILVSVYYKKK